MEHLSVVSEAVPDAADIYHACLHGAVGTEPVPVSVDHLPAVLTDTALVQIILLSVQRLPAGQHDAFTVHVEPVRSVPDPARHHASVRVEAVPSVVDLFPADPHDAGTDVEIVRFPVQSLPSPVDGPVVLHPVGIAAVEDQLVLLHAVIAVPVPFAADLSPGVRRAMRGEILILEVDVDAAVDSGNDPRFGALPHDRIFILQFALVGGAPDRILSEGVHVQLVGEPVIVGVEDGIIAGVADLFAESVHDRRDLFLGAGSQGLRVLRVKSDGIGDGIILDKVDDKVRLSLSHRHGGGVGVNVNADLDPGGVGIVRVLPEQRIHLVLVARAQHDEIHVIRMRRLPVDFSLPVRDINTAVQNAADGVAVFKQAVDTGGDPGQLVRGKALKRQRESQRRGKQNRAETFPFQVHLYELLPEKRVLRVQERRPPRADAA